MTRTETDGGGIATTSRALLRAGRALEQVRFKEAITSEKFYAYIKYDFGMFTNTGCSSQKGTWNGHCVPYSIF